MSDEENLRRNIHLLLKQVGDIAICKGCGKEIYWVKHKNGKATPYNTEGMNHFADCVKAQDFRKEKPREARGEP